MIIEPKFVTEARKLLTNFPDLHKKRQLVRDFCINTDASIYIKMEKVKEVNSELAAAGISSILHLEERVALWC